jgi:hypothetical protein
VHKVNRETVHPVLAHIEKVLVARRAYETVIEHTETLELDNMGASLAYLMGAILTDSAVDLYLPPSMDEHIGPLWSLFCRVLPEDDTIFKYFRHMPADGMAVSAAD